MFISTDNGTNWTQDSTGLSGSWINSLSITGTGVYAATYGGVFLLPKNETTWLWPDTGFGSKGVYCLATIGDSVFAGTYNCGVFVSTIDGARWTQVSDGLPQSPVMALAMNLGGKGGPVIFAGTAGNGVYSSTNGGSSWMQVNTACRICRTRRFIHS